VPRQTRTLLLLLAGRRPKEHLQLLAMPAGPWDDARWREKDNKWTAGCRWLQAWWRHEELGLDPGPLSPKNPGRLVASMLPIDAPAGSNFLSAEIVEVVAARLDEGNHSGMINVDRLQRNLLSSQPACFNLFGPYVSEPNGLLGWVKTIDSAAAEVSSVRFEWAPPRESHFGGGSAFDAFVTYLTSVGRDRFLGVEVKYAENLAESSIDVRDVYVNFTESSEFWVRGASERLNTARLKQFWLNTLLGQSLATRGDRFETGSVVVVAPGADRSARSASGAVRKELVDPNRWLTWSPFEQVLEHAPTASAVDFRRRYLDFGPVAHLLDDDDPRRCG
jgi:hypothetical protein